MSAINLEKFKVKNFLSVGNIPLEIPLNQHKTTLIVGKNGAGKSALFLDALCYVLYNKPFRKINKPQLVNSINKKDCVVEIEFSTQNKKYKVRRGMKPTVFEIYENGKLLNQDSDSTDYQGYLEDNILRLKYKAFTQIVILGVARFVPFMQLTAQNRREIIEDILDIQIFSTMSAIQKARADQLKEQLGNVSRDIDILEAKISMQKKHSAEMEQDTQALIDTNNQYIKQKEQENEVLDAEIGVLQCEIEPFIEKIKQKNSIQKQWNEVYTLKTKLDQKKDHINNELEFFENHINCPTCKQEIEPTFKTTIVDQKQSSIDQLNKSLTDAEILMGRYDEKLKEVQHAQNRYDDLNRQISNGLNKIKLNEEFIERVNKETEKLKQKKVNPTNVLNLEEFKNQLINLQEQKDQLLVKQQILTIIGTLLKDNGPKAMIVKQYIPIINKLINKYLKIMGLFADFHLDENFQETIKARHMDNYSYESFSEGEKLRIDLAIMFTWREIAKIRSSISVNCLFMDEILDSSLELAGVDDFLKIVYEISNDNVFIISHKLDQMSDKFNNILFLEKKKGFTKIVTR